MEARSWTKWGFNTRPSACKSDALPAELCALLQTFSLHIPAPNPIPGATADCQIVLVHEIIRVRSSMNLADTIPVLQSSERSNGIGPVNRSAIGKVNIKQNRNGRLQSAERSSREKSHIALICGRP